MTVINDTRVVRLQRVAARTGHQHSADERIVEDVTGEIVTSADVVSLPPGSLITLQRGPGVGHTEEGSVLNAAKNDIGGVAGGQTTSVSFDSEDAGATAATIFVTEIDYALSLSAPGEYAVNYKTFQVKTYTAVPTTPGSRVIINYSWAPIREYLEWTPEDLDPDLVAFGVGPHQGADGYFPSLDGYATVQTVTEHYNQHSTAIETILAGLDGYHPDVTGQEHYRQHSEAIQAILQSLDGYGGSEPIRHIRQLGSNADDYPFNSVYSLDGYEYPLGEDRLLVYLNGIAQFPSVDYVERDTSTIEFAEQTDHDDIVDVLILPGSFSGAGGGTATLQSAYDNSGTKTVAVSNGQITFTQTEPVGSALRLTSVASVAPTVIADQGGSGEAARLRSVDGTTATLLVQKDTTARNTQVDSTIVERTTSSVLGGQTGIGSGFLTRLENSGTTLFNASRILTGTESATDSVEKTFLAIELSDDGVLTEHLRLTSDGSLGLNTSSPDAVLHVQGDGYFSQGVEMAGKLTLHNTPLAPLNVPVLIEQPNSLKNGDIWITNIGGTRRINVRIDGVTYSVDIT